MAEKPGKPEDEKLIAKNSNAYANYMIEEVVEAGIVLTGTEIKSLRTSSPNLRDAYVEVRRGGRTLEAFILNLHIGPYAHGNIWNHEPTRRRKLLLHRNQIDRIHGATIQDGRTCIPTRIYFKKGFAKIELGLGRGKKKADKRDSDKKKSADREMDRAMKASRNKK